MKKITLALLGYGVVGKALEKLYLEEKAAALKKIKCLCGEEIDLHLKWIFLRDPSTPVKCEALRTGCFEQILQDSEVDIVVELLGGLEPATTMIKKSMKKGKSVVTANKYALYEGQGEREADARKYGVQLHYEAAVAAGIPIIDTLRNRLFFEEITEVSGILNGTTNYILTRLAQGMTFEEALARADERGYLEADPRLDLEGYDSLHKIGILHYLIFGYYPKNIKREGIQRAASLNSSKKLKLIARAVEDHVEVALKEIDQDSPFYAIDEGINGLLFKTKFTHQLFFSGPGAGGEATALSVWADILSQARVL